MEATGAIGGADISKLMLAPASATSARIPMEGTFLQSLQALNVSAGPVMSGALQAQIPAASGKTALGNSLQTTSQNPQKPAGNVEIAKAVKLPADGARKPAVVAASTEDTKDTKEQADAATASVAPVAEVKSSGASTASSTVPPKVVADVSEPDAKAKPVADLSDGDASAKVAVKAQEEPHMKGCQDTGAVVVAKKSPRKDDASASDAQVAPATAEAGAAVQPPGQPLPAVTMPIAIANGANKNDLAAGSEDGSMVSQAGSLNASKASSPASAKPALRDTKKVDSTPAPATPQAKVETVAVNGTAPTPVQPHTDAAQASRDTSSVPTSILAPVSATHAGTSTVSAKVGDAAEATSANANVVSQASDVKTLIATPNVLEIGIASGSHGWLRVRAELGQMGEVTASVAAASAGAAEGLHKELPAISAYLAGEQVSVNSLVVHAAGEASGTPNATQNPGAGMQMGTETGTGRKDQNTPYSKELGQGQSDGTLASDTGLNLNFDASTLPSAVYANGSGNWLSVRV